MSRPPQSPPPPEEDEHENGGNDAAAPPQPPHNHRRERPQQQANLRPRGRRLSDGPVVEGVWQQQQQERRRRTREENGNDDDDEDEDVEEKEKDDGLDAYFSDVRRPSASDLARLSSGEKEQIAWKKRRAAILPKNKAPMQVLGSEKCHEKVQLSHQEMQEERVKILKHRARMFEESSAMAAQRVKEAEDAKLREKFAIAQEIAAKNAQEKEIALQLQRQQRINKEKWPSSNNNSNLHSEDVVMAELKKESPMDTDVHPEAIPIVAQYSVQEMCLIVATTVTSNDQIDIVDAAFAAIVEKCLSEHRSCHFLRACLQTMCKYLDNICQHPTDAKFRMFSKHKHVFKNILECDKSCSLFTSLGFDTFVGDGDDAAAAATVDDGGCHQQQEKLYLLFATVGSSQPAHLFLLYLASKYFARLVQCLPDTSNVLFHRNYLCGGNNKNNTDDEESRNNDHAMTYSFRSFLESELPVSTAEELAQLKVYPVISMELLEEPSVAESNVVELGFRFLNSAVRTRRRFRTYDHVSQLFAFIKQFAETNESLSKAGDFSVRFDLVMTSVQNKTLCHLHDKTLAEVGIVRELLLVVPYKPIASVPSVS